jgi:hypothetical protein
MKLSERLSNTVIDIFPWPKGLGFKNAETWWAYVRSQPEKDRIDFLMSVALLSDVVAVLLLQHDQDLLNKFQLTEQTKTTFSEIEASSVAEFARAAILKLAPFE